MSPGGSAGIHRIDAFDPLRHDRDGFRSGVHQVDNFFQRTANKLSKADNLRLYVMVDGNEDLVGFYAINASALDYTELPQRFARSRPGHGSIPATYISMMGVDRRFAGQGCGKMLLANALTRILALSAELGIAVILLDVIDCGDPNRVLRRRGFYEGFGFRRLPSHQNKPFLPLADVRASRSAIKSPQKI